MGPGGLCYRLTYKLDQPCYNEGFPWIKNFLLNFKACKVMDIQQEDEAILAIVLICPFKAKLHLNRNKSL